MGHLAEEDSISIGFCGGFYCHMGCNAASQGLYGLPRKISEAGRGGSPAEKKNAQDSTKRLLINFYQSQCFALWLIYSFTLLNFHSVFYNHFYNAVGLWIWSRLELYCLWPISTRQEEECEQNYPQIFFFHVLFLIYSLITALILLPWWALEHREILNELSLSFNTWWSLSRSTTYMWKSSCYKTVW